MCLRPGPARPIADIVAAINGAAQIPHLRGTVDDLTRQRGEGAEFCSCTARVGASRMNWGDGALCCWTCGKPLPAPAPDIAQLGGSVDVSALRADTHDVGPSPSVAQDSDRGTIHAANEAVSETKRHDD